MSIRRLVLIAERNRQLVKRLVRDSIKRVCDGMPRPYDFRLAMSLATMSLLTVNALLVMLDRESAHSPTTISIDSTPSVQGWYVIGKTGTRAGTESPRVSRNHTHPEANSSPPTWSDDALEAIVDDLPRHKTELRIPETMRYDTTETVTYELTLTQARETLQERYEGRIDIGEILVAPEMSAELIGESGFDIEAARETRRAMAGRDQTWEWQVTPKTPGPQRLNLKVTAYAHVDGAVVPVDVTPERRNYDVEVTLTLSQQWALYGPDKETAWTVAGSGGWVAAAVLFGWLSGRYGSRFSGWFFRQRRPIGFTR